MKSSKLRAEEARELSYFDIGNLTTAKPLRDV